MDLSCLLIVPQLVKEFISILWNQKVNYNFYVRQTLDPILSQFKFIPHHHPLFLGGQN
jgi:hypothetical protein